MSHGAVIAIAGPTGVGKSALALDLAQAVGGEIVNYDSIQIYRGFDLGSAKPTPAQRSEVPHHLYDIIEATEEFHAAEYAARASLICSEIRSRGRVPIFVGGTGFYLRAFLSGLPALPGKDPVIRQRLRQISNQTGGPSRLHRWLLRVDPETGERVAPSDRHRLERALEVYLLSGRPISSWQRPTGETPAGIPHCTLALTMARSMLLPILDRRVVRMFEDGLIEETRDLLQRYPVGSRPFGSIGYREAAGVITGESDIPSAIAGAQRRTRAYAKRQLTWLRSERNLNWIESTGENDDILATTLTILESDRLE